MWWAWRVSFRATNRERGQVGTGAGSDRGVVAVVAVGTFRGGLPPRTALGATAPPLAGEMIASEFAGT